MFTEFIKSNLAVIIRDTVNIMSQAITMRDSRHQKEACVRGGRPKMRMQKLNVAGETGATTSWLRTRALTKREANK